MLAAALMKVYSEIFIWTFTMAQTSFKNIPEMALVLPTHESVSLEVTSQHKVLLPYPKTNCKNYRSSLKF